MLLIGPATGKILDANFAAQDFYGHKNLLDKNMEHIEKSEEEKE